MTNNRWVRNSLIYLLIIIGVIVIFYTLIPSLGSSEQLSLTEVMGQASTGQIERIIVDGEKLTVIPRVARGGDTTKYTSRIGKKHRPDPAVYRRQDPGPEPGKRGPHPRLSTRAPAGWAASLVS